MRAITIVVLFGLTALCSSSVILGDRYQNATPQFLEKQKIILEVLHHLNQPQLQQQYYQDGITYNILDNLSMYYNVEAIQEFLKLYQMNVIEKDEIFSIMNQRHRDYAVALFHVLYYAKDWDTFYKSMVWANVNVNKGAFIYALTVSVLHRPDMVGMELPAPYELYPYFFFNAEVIQKAQQIKMKGLYGMKQVDGVYKIVVQSNFTGDYYSSNPEQKISYFTEDIGLNTYYYYFHCDYPFWMGGPQYGLNKDRRGELYLFEHQQLLARYFLERLSNDLGEIEDLVYRKPMKNGYYPNLRYYNGIYFPVRDDDYNFYTENNYYDIMMIEDYERRIRDAIDYGYVVLPDGTQIDLTKPESVELLGNMIQGNPDQPLPTYFKYIAVYAKLLLGGNIEAVKQGKVIPSVLEQYETAMRDPLFYSLYKRLLKFYWRFMEHLPTYTRDDLVFQGIKIESAAVDKLITYFDKYDADITNAVDVENPEAFGSMYQQEQVQPGYYQGLKQEQMFGTYQPIVNYQEALKQGQISGQYQPKVGYQQGLKQEQYQPVLGYQQILKPGQYQPVLSYQQGLKQGQFSGLNEPVLGYQQGLKQGQFSGLYEPVLGYQQGYKQEQVYGPYQQGLGLQQGLKQEQLYGPYQQGLPYQQGIKSGQFVEQQYQTIPEYQKTAQQQYQPILGYQQSTKPGFYQQTPKQGLLYGQSTYAPSYGYQQYGLRTPGKLNQPETTSSEEVSGENYMMNKLLGKEKPNTMEYLGMNLMGMPQQQMPQQQKLMGENLVKYPGKMIRRRRDLTSMELNQPSTIRMNPLLTKGQVGVAYDPMIGSYEGVYGDPTGHYTGYVSTTYGPYGKTGVYKGQINKLGKTGTIETTYGPYGKQGTFQIQSEPVTQYDEKYGGVHSAYKRQVFTPLNVMSKTQGVNMPIENVVVYARQNRLNHLPFNVKLNVLSDKPVTSVVRIYLGPKYDSNGNLYDINENRKNFYLLDAFKYNLVPGKNVIVRNSREFTWFVRDRTPYLELYKWVMTAKKGETNFPLDLTEAHCGFPDRLMLPKGKLSGMPLQMYFIITPYIAPQLPQGSTYNSILNCGVGSGSRYIDSLPMGYPFDRVIDEKSWYTPNMYNLDVMVYHKPSVANVYQQQQLQQQFGLEQQSEEQYSSSEEQYPYKVIEKYIGTQPENYYIKVKYTV